MYAATCKVIEYLSDYSLNERFKVEVHRVYKNMTRFEFVFILDLIHKIMKIIDFCQILQKKNLKTY